MKRQHRSTAELTEWIRKEGSALVAAGFTADNTRLLLAAEDGEVLVRDLSENAEQPIRFSVKPDDAAVRIFAAAIRADGRYAAVVGRLAESGESIGWVYALTDDRQPRLHAVIHGHEAGGIRGIAFLPDSPYVVTGGADGDVLIWNWQPDRKSESAIDAYEAYQFLVSDRPKSHKAPVADLSVSDNGLIATVSDDGTAIIWQNPFR